MFYKIKFAFGSFRIWIRIPSVWSDSDSDPSKRSDPFGFGFGFGFGSPTLLDQYQTFVIFLMWLICGWTLPVRNTPTASSTAISSKGFMLCFTPSVTTPSLSGRTLQQKHHLLYKDCKSIILQGKQGTQVSREKRWSWSRYPFMSINNFGSRMLVTGTGTSNFWWGHDFEQR